MSERTTRSRSRNAAAIQYPPETFREPSPPTLMLKDQSLRKIPTYLNDHQLHSHLKRLPSKSLRLLQLKQRKLRDPDAQLPTFVRQNTASQPSLVNAAASTFVFVGEAAGTAVCISPPGLLLTCSHCVAEINDELELEKEWWLLSAHGQPVKAQCVACDPKRDLALLQVTTAPSSSFTHIAESPPKRNTRLICVGHPGSEDFEAAKSGVPTGYDVLHISEGRFRGYAPAQDVQDNPEIGALQHDCWTYWGHSGAPLIERATGQLVGLHSSWDDSTGMRRGVALEAIIGFLDEHCDRA